VWISAEGAGGEGGGMPAKITRARQSERGPVARLCFMCFLSQQYLYMYLSIVQTDPLRPKPIHSATESQSLRLCIEIFSRSALVGEGRKKFFQLVSNPLSEVLMQIEKLNSKPSWHIINLNDTF
jgi:hypothetical protein